METLGDLLARERRTGDLAVRIDGGAPADPRTGNGSSVEYTYHDFVTTAWKTANFFSHRGVREGATVGVVDDAAVPALFAFLGAAQLGSVTRFEPPRTVEATLLVGPGEAVLSYDLPPGATRVAYTAGGNVEDPAVAAFGRSVWSENPVEPPEEVAPHAPALAADDGTVSQTDLLARAEAAAADLAPGDEVVVRAPLAAVDTVVAGVLAPLLAGATVVFPGDGTVGDVAVAAGPAPEGRVVSVANDAR